MKWTRAREDNPPEPGFYLVEFRPNDESLTYADVTSSPAIMKVYDSINRPWGIWVRHTADTGGGESWPIYRSGEEFWYWPEPIEWPVDGS